MSQVEKVLSALENGEQLTAKQIAARFKAGNPHDVILKIREQGYPVFLNRTVNSKGEVKNKYRLGTPTRAMVAAGYLAIRAGLDDFLN